MSASPGSDAYRGKRPFSAPETRALRDFVAYAKQFDDVWFATREEIAEWYLQNHKSHIG